MNKKVFWSFVLVLIVMAAGMLYPLNYYVMKPGSAYDLTKYVEVKDGDAPGDGKLSMMTVSMGIATPFTYVWAKLGKNMDVLTKEEVLGDQETNEQYNERQLHLMTDSQFNAKYVAFKETKKPFTVDYKGVYVTQVVAKSASDGILETGDEITALDGKKIQKHDELVAFLKDKKKGDTVNVQIERNKKTLTKKITLREISKDNQKIGLGIAFDDSKSIKTTPDVTIHSEDIGGPSAGLMFTLEIIDQLTTGDLTKGYNIAGTGEMNEDGTVGRIGGIDKKVVAAHDAGVDIFFAPDDDVSEYQKIAPEAHIQSNYDEAKASAKENDITNMKIVPVKNVEDALDYLEALKAKKAS